LTRALSTDATARFASMHELADAIEAAAPPRANARRIGEWVLELAKDALAERTRKLARVENWVVDEIPLKSTPFAAELPLRPPSPSSRPPEVFRANLELLDIPPAPPLPASVSAALRSSSVPPTSASDKEGPVLAVARAISTSKKGSRWWLWALVALGVAAYFVLRPS
jgi:hypothetical protein